MMPTSMPPATKASRPSNESTRDVEVTRLPSGQPEIALHNKAAELADARGVGTWLLTLTHTDSMAMAVAVALQ